MKKLIFILILILTSISFSKITVIVQPNRIISGYINSKERSYKEFLSDCEYYPVQKTWYSQNGRDFFAQLSNGNIEKIKGKHIPYIQVGQYCNIPNDLK